MAGVSTIGTGGDYSLISAWESAVNTSGLVGVEEGQLLGEVFAEIVLIDGGATTVNDYCHLTTADGAEFDHVTKLGARIVVAGITANTDIVMLKDPFHRLGGNTANNGTSTGAIGISYDASSAVVNCSGIRCRQAGSNIIKQAVFYDIVSGGAAFGYWDDGSNNDGRIDLINCAAINLETTSAVGGDAMGFTRTGGTLNSYATNCSAHDIRAGVNGDDAVGFTGMVEVNNCWAGECISLNPAGQSDGFFADGSMTTCASSDGTGSVGLQNLVSADQFVSSVAPYDLHLKTGSALIGAGTDSYGVTWDIDGAVSGARDDIGVDQTESAPQTSAVSAVDSALLAAGVAVSQADSALSSGVAVAAASDSAMSSFTSIINQLDALLEGGQQSTVSGDSALEAALSAQAQVDALVEKFASLSQSSDALITGGSSVSSLVGAALSSAISAQASVGSVISKAVSMASNTDSVLTGSTMAASNADAVLRKLATTESALDAVIVGLGVIVSSMDAAMMREVVSGVGVDASLMSDLFSEIGVDSAMTLALSNAGTTDAILTGGGNMAAQSDAVVSVIVQLLSSIDGCLKKAYNVAQACDVYIVNEVSAIAYDDALIKSSMFITASVDVVTSSLAENIMSIVGRLRAYSAISIKITTGT